MTTRLADYIDKYRCAHLDRDDQGVLLVRIHTDGGEMLWGADDDDDKRLADLFLDIADDPENRAVILTGTGDVWCTGGYPGHSGQYHHPESFEEVFRLGRKMHQNFLDIEVPIIAAVNGPALVHAELLLMSDIVVAAETATFGDRPHFPAGIPPGDGVQIIWPMLLGPIRAKYFLLTGQEIGADEALQLGVVNEVLPRDELLKRAYALAHTIVAKPPLTVRYTRRVMNLALRRAVNDDFDHALALEGLAIVQLRGWRESMGGAPPVWETPPWAHGLTRESEG